MTKHTASLLKQLFLEKTYSAGTQWNWKQALLATLAAFTVGFVALMVAWDAMSSMGFPAGASSDFDREEIRFETGFLLFQAIVIYVMLYASTWGRTPGADPLLLRLPHQVMVAAILVSVAFVAISSFDFLLCSLAPASCAADSENIARTLGSEALWISVAATVIGAPLSEELVFRGFLLTALTKSRLGFLGASLVTTLIWTSLHLYSPTGLLAIFASGLCLCYLVWRTNSIWPPIALHALMNAWACLSIIKGW